MKTLLPFLLITLLATLVSAADSAVHRAKILKIESQIQQTPRFAINGVKDKPFDPRYWLEIEVEVEVETTDPSGFIPELKSQWFAVIKDNNQQPVRLTGEVTFRNIRTKGKKVHLSAYIEPDTLEKLTGKSRPSDHDVEGVAIQISGRGIMDTGRYAKGLVKATAEAKAGWWQQWKGQNLDHHIIAKSKTPFAPLWTDRYPAEAPKQ